MEILPLFELNDLLITKYLDPLDDYKNLCQINKYYNELIKNNKLYINLYEFKKSYHKAPLKDYANSFTSTCYYGYLDIVKYFYNKYQINFGEYDLAFKYACKNGIR